MLYLASRRQKDGFLDMRMRACWNRQTGTFEGRVLMACGFKSHCSHQYYA